MFLIFSFSGISQSLDSIKHIEIISEIQDSMALINLEDVNKVNKLFHDYRKLDSLDKINSKIIETLEIKNHFLDSILVEQKAIVQNQKAIELKLRNEIDSKSQHYEKLLLKEQRRKTLWQTTTGVGLIAILVILLL